MVFRRVIGKDSQTSQINWNHYIIIILCDLRSFSRYQSGVWTFNFIHQTNISYSNGFFVPFANNLHTISYTLVVAFSTYQSANAGTFNLPHPTTQQCTILITITAIIIIITPRELPLKDEFRRLHLFCRSFAYTQLSVSFRGTLDNNTLRNILYI